MKKLAISKILMNKSIYLILVGCGGKFAIPIVRLIVWVQKICKENNIVPLASPSHSHD